MRHFIALATSLTLLAACGDSVGYRDNPNTYKGAGIGAAAGALAGSMESSEYAAAGAGLGVLAGGAIGAYMDKQEREMRRQLEGSGVAVQREGDNILLNMPNSITFGFDSSRVRSDFYGTLNNVAGVLNQYQQSMVEVVGHTDSTGTDSYNQDLSLRRARAVAEHLKAQAVTPNRLIVIGRGEAEPIASNATASGQAQNRRVEIRISPITTGSMR